MPTPIKRRSFLGYLLLTFALSRCKQEIITPTASNKTPAAPVPVNSVPSVGPADHYLGQYTTTELGSKVDTFPQLDNFLHGYTDKLSYGPSEPMSLYLSGAENANEKIQFYDALGNTVLTVNTPIVNQKINTSKPWIDGQMFNKTTSVTLPANLKSGVYSVNGRIPFVCKGTNSVADMTIVYPSNTINAYNPVGGKSDYTPDLNNRSTVSSFLRYPIYGDSSAAGFYRWMLTQNYSANYITDADLDDYTQIQDSKIVVITGHSEYWTRQARVNIDKFIASGKNVLVLSGNTMWWQVRYNLQKSLMICYKDNHLDPLGNTIYSTINWTDPILNYPVMNTLGADYISGGFGQELADGFNGYKIVNDQSPLLEGTGLKNGDILNLPTFEYDCAPLEKVILPGSTEIPVIDNSKLNAHKIELLGYDFATNGPKKHGMGTFVVYQRTASSGIVVNTASMNWCSQTGMNGGKDEAKLKIITKNMIDRSLNGETLFTS